MDLSDFQVNDYVQYRMFNLLDDYPSLYEAVNSLDQTTFNHRLGDAVSFKEDEFISMTQDTIDLLNYTALPGGAPSYHRAHPVPEMLKRLRKVMYRVNNQDIIDRETGTTSYAQNFFGFIDTIRDADVGYENDVLDIMRKGAEYNLEREYAEPGYLLKHTEEAIADLIDPDHLLVIQYNQQVTAKRFIQSYGNMMIDGDGKLVPDGDSGTDTGLGNSARGTGALLKGLFELIGNAGIRESVYDVIRELGAMSAVKIPTALASYNAAEVDYAAGNYATDGFKRMKDITREEICNIEDFFTEGGAVREAQSIYNRNDADEYSDTEIRNATKETLPGTIALLMREDRPGSMIADGGGKDYLLTKFIRSLKNLGIDWNKSRVEESLYDLMRFDIMGRDRLTDANAYAVSHLESALITGGVTSNMGWTDGGATGESGHAPNAQHGHGEATGKITLTDSIFSIRTVNTIDIDWLSLHLGMYEVGFGNEGKVFRSRKPFTYANRNNYKMTYDQNYPAL